MNFSKTGDGIIPLVPAIENLVRNPLKLDHEVLSYQCDKSSDLILMKLGKNHYNGTGTAEGNSHKKTNNV